MRCKNCGKDIKTGEVCSQACQDEVDQFERDIQAKEAKKFMKGKHEEAGKFFYENGWLK